MYESSSVKMIANVHLQIKLYKQGSYNYTNISYINMEITVEIQVSMFTVDTHVHKQKKINKMKKVITIKLNLCQATLIKIRQFTVNPITKL